MTSFIITWLNGVSALSIVIVSWIFAIWCVYQYRKTKNNIFLNGLLLSLAVAFGWTGITLSFLSVVIYGSNLPGLKPIVNAFSYSTIPFGSLAIIYVSWDVAASPRSKKIMLFGFIVFSILYYIVLFMTFDEAIACPDVPDGEIYDDWIVPGSFFYYLVWAGVGVVSTISFIGFIKLLKASEGDIKKRALYIVLAAPIFGTCILLDTVIFMEPHVNFLFIPRFLMNLGGFLIYLGFRPPKSDV